MNTTHVGRVDSVTIDSERRTIFVDVITSPRKTFTDVKFVMPGSGMWAVPEEGSVVEVVSKTGQETVAHFPRQQPSFDLPPGLSEGDIALQVGDDSFIHFQTSGDTVDVRLDVSGDIFIGDPNNSKKVATEDHVHDFEYTGGGDNSSTLTGTTGNPDDVTDAEVE